MNVCKFIREGGGVTIWGEGGYLYGYIFRIIANIRYLYNFPSTIQEIGTR